MSAAIATRMTDLFRRIETTGLVFGIRTAATALVTLWLAMWLQLDTPRWAAWTAMSLALPTRGQVGLKGIWRFAGTAVGLSAALVAVANLAQAPLLMGAFVALFCGLNSYLGGRSPGLAGYGTTLASLTAALVISSCATAPLASFDVAVARGASIVLGLACVYAASALAESLQGPRHGPAFPPGPQPSRETALANALRAILVVSFAWTFWIASAWPGGAVFVTFAAVTSTIFATMPNGDRRAWDYLIGAVIGQILGLGVRFVLLTAPGSFGLLAAILFPFLLLGAVALTDQRTLSQGTGYNFAFLTAVDPVDPMTYDLAASLNQALATFAGIGFGALAYRYVLPRHVWRIPR